MDASETPFRGPLAGVLERQADTDAAGVVASIGELLAPPGTALPVPPAADRDAWRAADAVGVAAIIARADDDLNRPWPHLRASDAARVHRDGDRVDWETAAFERQHRLSRAVLAAIAEPEPRRLDEVVDGVMLLCEQSSWCWPAHDDAHARHGSMLGVPDDPFVDLGAGEAVAQLAWIDHVLGAELEERVPGLRARIRREARGRVLRPFVDRRDWHWIGLTGDVHNWNPWIHGNVLVAALQLMDADDPERARVVALALEGLDRYLAALPDDGAIDEGYAYWWNGACRALEALDVLAEASGGRLDATADIAALRETVAFPHRMHLGEGWYLNVADGQARPDPRQPWHALHRAARRVGDADALAHAAAHRDPASPAADESAGLGRMLRGLTDAAWLAAVPGASPLPREVRLDSVHVLIAREAARDAAGLTLAVKGGHNGENHNHNDVGSFVVAVDGVPVIVDAGRPSYTAATFGPERYAIWTMQSSWHTVPEVRGAPQSPGAEHGARDVAVTIADEAAELALDLAPAYPAGAAHNWRRRARLERTPTPRVVVDDAWSLPATRGDHPPTRVHLLVAGGIRMLPDGALVTPLAGARRVRVRWPAGLPAHVEVRELDDPMLTAVWGDRLTRIALDVEDRDRLSVAVELVHEIDEDSHER